MCIMCFAIILRGKTLYPNNNVQNNSRDNYTRSYITFIWLWIIKSIAILHAFLSCTFIDSYDFTHKDVFCQPFCQGIWFRSPCHVRHTVFYEHTRSQNLPLHVSMLQTTSYASTWYYDSTYEEMFCASP